MATAVETLIDFNMEDYLDNGILRESPFRERLKQIDWSQYQEQKVIIKWCHSTEIPTWAYMLVTACLTPYVDYIGFGESCSAVTIYKKRK